MAFAPASLRSKRARFGPAAVDAGLMALGSVLLPLFMAQGARVSAAEQRPADFGRQWVRSHPFTIMGAVYVPAPLSFDIDQYLSMNLNTVFVNDVQPRNAQIASDAGVPWQIHYDPGQGTHPYQPYTEAQKSQLDQLLAIGHGDAVMLPDEPQRVGEFEALAASARWLNQAHPEVLVYVDLRQVGTDPNDPNVYLEGIVDTIRPDLVAFNRYPFLADGSTDASDWFSTLMRYRQVSLSRQIPYSGWLQSFDDHGATNVRVPSESDTRFQGFTLLAAGATTLSYYVYQEPPDRMASPLLDANWQPTSLYLQAAAANLEYAHLGQSLRFLTSANVRFVPGRHILFGNNTVANTAPAGLSKWTAGAGGDAHLLAAAVDVSQPGSIGLEKDGLISLFADDGGQRYLMLTNLYHSASASAADASLSFVLTFDNTVNHLLRLNRITGEPEKVMLNNHVLNLSLPGGTGDLFKYEGGFFAGIPGGDATLDGKVDVVDLGALATNWQRPGTWKNGDFNLDGFVDVVDLGILATNWQLSARPGSAQSMADALAALGLSGTAIPEPAAACSLAGLMAMHLLRDRSRPPER